MPVSQHDLDAILRHCRQLLDAAAELDTVAAERHQAALQALVWWSGDHATTFRARRDDEAADLSSCAADLRHDADAWARVWADTVNEANRRRRDVAVDLVKANRGLGEQFVDRFVGDDSADQIRPYQPVTMPTAASYYAATGGLETF